MAGNRSPSSQLPLRALRGDDPVRELASAGPAVGAVGPRALHGEGAGGKVQIGRATRAAGRDPGAEVGILEAAGVGPAAGRVLVSDRLGELVAVDDRDAIELAGVAGADE